LIEWYEMNAVCVRRILRRERVITTGLERVGKKIIPN